MKTLLPIISIMVLSLMSCANSAVIQKKIDAANFEHTHQQMVKTNGTTKKTKVKTQRKVIYNASCTLSYHHKTVDSVKNAIITLTDKYEGYVLSLYNYKAMIRVPAKDLHKVIEELKKVGKVSDKTLMSKDVTIEYNDYEIRLDNAKKTRKRYLELLKKATKVDEILEIERELERLNKEIDLIKGNLKKLSHLISFSTITINIRGVTPELKKPKPGILGYVFVGLYKGVRWLFVRD